MTAEELLGLPKPIAELSDLELEAHFAKFFPDTRPAKPLASLLGEHVSSESAGDLTDAQLQLKAELAKVGLNLDGTRRTGKKFSLTSLPKK